MRYADTLLADGEHITLRTRQHWVALLIDARYGLLLWGIALLDLIVVLAANPGPGILRDLLGWIGLGAFVIGLLLFLFNAWGWWAEDYLVTNRRIVKVDGILTKHSADSSLEKINDAELYQGIIGRLLGYGDLVIATAAETAIDRFHLLRDPVGFKREMLDQKHALETGAEDRLPSPPLRAAPAPAATPTPAPAAAQPAVPAPAASAPTADATQVAQALEQLKQLRDGGAITPEEYEAKKAELLGRL